MGLPKTKENLEIKKKSIATVKKRVDVIIKILENNFPIPLYVYWYSEHVTLSIPSRLLNL